MDKKEVYILKQDHFGRGIARIDEKLVFVEDALPSEKCQIEIIEDKKKFSVAVVDKFIETSDFRTIPKCPFYSVCGGCHIMHEERQHQLEFKEMKVKELLERFADLRNITVFPIVYDDDFYYRNKIIIHGNGRKLGFYREKTHDIVAIDECLITSKQINSIYKRIQNYLDENELELIDNLMIRDTSTGELMICVDGKIDEDNFVLTFNDMNSIYINKKLVYGNKYITENLFNLHFKVYPDSFFQVNYKMMMKLYKKVRDFYEDKNYSTVLDLYCGTGTIGMVVSKFVDSVIGVEVVESSIESALECMKENGINNISFKCGKVEDMIDTFNNVDSIIVDPPRKGLDLHTTETILKLGPKTIVYISCDPVTLVRDLNILSQKYKVLEVTPFDMFPNTYHVENIVILSKN